MAFFFVSLWFGWMLSRTRAALSTTSMKPAKDLFILRHGQATHNPRAEKAKDEGCDFETFLELMRQDDSLDSELTELGRRQAKDVYANFAKSWEKNTPFDVVIASPLSRCLQTADHAAPPQQFPNRICHEHFREINGLLLNAKRRTRTELEALYQHWDLQHITDEHDVYWTEELENTEECRNRGYQGLHWIMQRPEQRMLLVCHGGILLYTMTQHPHVHVRDARKNKSEARKPHDRFTNCELRRYQISLEHDLTATNVILTEIDVDDNVPVQQDEPMEAQNVAQ